MSKPQTNCLVCNTETKLALCDACNNKALLDKAIEVIKFYANNDTYKRTPNVGFDTISIVEDPAGEKAREFLERIEK